MTFQSDPIPRKVYLQIYDEDGELLDPVRGHVSWSSGRIQDYDVEYVRCSENHDPEVEKYKVIIDLLVKGIDAQRGNRKPPTGFWQAYRRAKCFLETGSRGVLTFERD